MCANASTSTHIYITFLKECKRSLFSNLDLADEISVPRSLFLAHSAAYCAKRRNQAEKATKEGFKILLVLPHSDNMHWPRYHCGRLKVLHICTTRSKIKYGQIRLHSCAYIRQPYTRARMKIR